MIQKLEYDSFRSETLCYDRVRDVFELPFVKKVIEDDLSYLNDIRLRRWKDSFSSYIVFGIGGSSLGGQAINETLGDNSQRVIFCDTIDPLYFYSIIRELDLSEVGFLVISKSGETIETISQMLVVISKYERERVKEHFLVITENKESTLNRICEDFGIGRINHPKDIGGRFSVLSPTGMVVSYLMDLDCAAFISGARRALSDIDKIEDCAKFIFSFYERGIFSNVLFIYSERLYKFGLWLSQLLAESTGKDGKGITPILAKGPIDQHSQLQNYLGGKRDKAFMFFIDESSENYEIIENTNGYEKIKFLKGKTIKDLFLAEAAATMGVICEEKIPTMSFTIEKLSEEEIGYMFMYFMLVTVFTCDFLGVDPFNQPHVEKGKVLIKDMI